MLRLQDRGQCVMFRCFFHVFVCVYNSTWRFFPLSLDSKFQQSTHLWAGYCHLTLEIWQKILDSLKASEFKPLDAHMYLSLTWSPSDCTDRRLGGRPGVMSSSNMMSGTISFVWLLLKVPDLRQIYLLPSYAPLCNYAMTCSHVFISSMETIRIFVLWRITVKTFKVVRLVTLTIYISWNCKREFLIWTPFEMDLQNVHPYLTI